MRIAVLANVQGNRSALEAVLADIQRRGSEVERIISVGDQIGRGPEPNEVLEMLRANEVESVMGNYDQAIASNQDSSGSDFATRAAEEADSAALRWTRHTLSPENLDYVSALPRTLRLFPAGRGVKVARNTGDERANEFRRTFFMRAVVGGLARPAVRITKRILVLHGSPRALNEFIRLDTARSILLSLRAEAQADLLITGHAGQSFRRDEADMTFIGAGAVDRPGDSAEYVVITTGNQIETEFVEVEYDREQHVAALLRSSLPHSLARM